MNVSGVPVQTPTPASPSHPGAHGKAEPRNTPKGIDLLELAAIGLEAEFELWIDGRKLDPRRVFGSPQRFVRESLMHRQGTSYHLPTGGAVYFDTGVIEVATPVIEIQPGCAERAGRSLWEAILFVRDELSGWEQRTRRSVRLVGFSAHYNISFELPRHMHGTDRTVDRLALLLSHILPVPVMILAANRRSTGVGVRPRGDRIEITVDFTPSPALTIATAALITGIARDVMTWRRFDLAELETRRIPRVAGFVPKPHTSRRGLLAHASSFPHNPFTADIDAPLWPTTDGRVVSLRRIGAEITRAFWHPVRRLAEPFTLRLIASIMRGRAPSLLDLEDRPDEYEDVGRLCRWDDLFPERMLSRSLYERVLIHAIRGERLRIGQNLYSPVGMKGWSRVVFRRENDGTLHTFTIDYLLRHLREWGRDSRPRRTATPTYRSG
jgi:hypothetical protein